MRGKKYLLVLVIAIVSLAMVSVPVKASPYVKFFVDVSAGPGYIPGPPLDIGEFIYADLNVPGAYLVSAGDKRLSPVTVFGITYAAGTLVASGDLDIGLSLSGAWGVLKHRDNGATATKYDFGEYIYSDKDTNSIVSAGDIRYYPVPGYTLGSIVATGDTDQVAGWSLIPFYPTTIGKYERFVDNLVANGVYDFAKVLVDIMIDTDIPDNTASGIVGWGLEVRINPAVLTPVDVIGAMPGYFLADFVGRRGLTVDDLLVSGLVADGMIPSEMLSPAPTTGAGNQSVPPDYLPAEKLVTLVFSPLSQTAWSKIDLIAAPKGNYMTPDGSWHTVTLMDGDYNQPEIPEFPLGIEVIMAIAPLIPIIYLWRKRPKRRAIQQ